MKKILSLLAAVVLCSSIWADTASITYSEMGYTNGSELSTEDLDDNISISYSKGGANNPPKFYDSDNTARIYGLGTFTISGTDGVTISQIDIASTGNVLYANVGTYSNGTWTGSAQAVTFTSGTSKVSNTKITSITVTYTTAGGDKVASISASDLKMGVLTTPTSHPIIIRHDTITVEAKNLTAALTLTAAKNDTFSVTPVGELTTDGGKLAVLFRAEEERDYAYSFTLTSGSTSATVNISATVVFTTGKGTQEAPYTTADVKLLNNRLTEDAWVEGVIAGVYNNNEWTKEIGSINTNIALAADMEGTDVIPVQLPSSGTFRSDLALTTHPENLGRTVKIQGSLTTYFSTTGIKEPKAYELVAVAPQLDVKREGDVVTVTPDNNEGTYYVNVVTPEQLKYWLAPGVDSASLFTMMVSYHDIATNAELMRGGVQTVDFTTMTEPGTYIMLAAAAHFSGENLIIDGEVFAEGYEVAEKNFATISYAKGELTITPAAGLEEVRYSVLVYNAAFRSLIVSSAELEEPVSDEALYNLMLNTFGWQDFLWHGTMTVDIEDKWLSQGEMKLTNGDYTCIIGRTHKQEGGIEREEGFNLLVLPFTVSDVVLTDVEEVVAIKVRKQMIDGQLYIEREGRRYNVLGQ